jgi:hypothetical protein
MVADIHSCDIGSIKWHKQQCHAPCGILKMSINGVSTVLGLAYFVIKASREVSPSLLYY